MLRSFACDLAARETARTGTAAAMLAEAIENACKDVCGETTANVVSHYNQRHLGSMIATSMATIDGMAIHALYACTH